MKDKLNSIVAWLNDNYNQDSDDYDVFMGARPGVVEFDDETVVSFWGCGAIVCIRSGLYFIMEDDGNWFIENSDDKYGYPGVQSTFSIAWSESFRRALENIEKYVQENGKPVYYSGTNVVCNYTL